jgi:hypothetical protein
MYIFTCYILTKSFHEKSTCCVACVQKIKLGAENKAFHKINFLFFYIEHKKYRFSVKTLRTHKDCEEVGAIFLSIFNDLK